MEIGVSKRTQFLRHVSGWRTRPPIKRLSQAPAGKEPSSLSVGHEASTTEQSGSSLITAVERGEGDMASDEEEAIELRVDYKYKGLS